MLFPRRVAASRVLYGVPDNGIIGLRELVDHARQMALRTDIPILVDADTGFGNAVNVYYAVREIVQSGVAAMSIEDQEAPKKSATDAGRRCISLEEAVGKIQAAAAARDEMDPEFAICARGDILGAEGGNFDEALRALGRLYQERRRRLHLAQLGRDAEQVKRACKEIPAPVLAIWGGEEARAVDRGAGRRWACASRSFRRSPRPAGPQAAWEQLNEFRERGLAALWPSAWPRRRPAAGASSTR